MRSLCIFICVGILIFCAIEIISMGWNGFSVWLWEQNRTLFIVGNIVWALSLWGIFTTKKDD